MSEPGAVKSEADGWADRIGIGSFVLFLIAFFVLIHWHYPDTGHDFGAVFVRLLEGAWHFHHHGLAIPRYAVHVCGGSVLYGHPEDMFYSPTQILSLLMDPWLTIQLTVCAALIAGYVGWYRVGTRILRLPGSWSHLLALVVEANGFYFVQMLSGHFMFHALALLGWFVLLVFEHDEPPPRARLKTAIAFALLCAYTLYAGGWFVLYVAGLGCLLVLPLDLFLAENPANRALLVLRRLLLFSLPTLALTGSKLVAIYSFMRHFPRHHALETMDVSHSALGFIVKALWAIPQNAKLFAAMPGLVHERSALMAPITLVGLAAGLFLLGRRLRAAAGGQRDRWFAVIYGTVVFAAMIQLVRGRGFLAQGLHSLPVGASQRLSSRYLYPFALLLSVVSVWCLAKFMGRLGRRWHVAILLAGSLTTVATFATGYVEMLPEVGLASNMRDHREHWRRVDRGRSVNEVKHFTDFDGGTGRTCYEPILNSSGDPSHVLHLGPVHNQQDGFFNLMNPACYQYPDENDCKPGDRISIADAQNLYNFAHGLPVTWKVSTVQQIADATSALALVFFLLALRYLRGRSSTSGAEPGRRGSQVGAEDSRFPGNC